MAALSSCDPSTIGRSIMPSTVRDRMTRVLFGLDDDRMAKQTIVTMDRTCIPLRDDISLFIALIHYDIPR